MAPRLSRALSLAILTAAALAPAGALTTSRQTVRFKNRIDGKEVSLSYRKFGSGQASVCPAIQTMRVRPVSHWPPPLSLAASRLPDPPTISRLQSKIVMIMGTAAPQDAWQRQVDALSHSHQAASPSCPPGPAVPDPTRSRTGAGVCV